MGGLRKLVERCEVPGRRIIDLTGRAPEHAGGRRAVLALMVVAISAATATYADLPAVAAFGVRTGPFIGRTDLTDSVSGFGEAFVRMRTRDYPLIEANAGYSRLTGDGYATDIGQLGLRLILEPAVTGRWQPGQWQPLVYGGVGLLRQDIDEFSPRSTVDAESIAWSASLPLGVGLRRILSPGMALEIHANYTYTLRDDLDSASLNKGNDMLFSLGLGLVFGRFEAPPARRAGGIVHEETAPAGARAVDRDGDGLTDEAETRRWFTNPLMTDSDIDGLTDGQEVETFGTDPNRADTDGDGVLDGAEMAVGRDPLVADAHERASPPAVPAPLESIPIESAPVESVPRAPTTFEFASISFASGGSRLTAEARNLLKQVAWHLQQDPVLEIEVRGFSDSLGERRDNLRLAGKRCGVVRDYLVQLGIEDWRLTLEAYGEDEPVASNSTREGRRMNRRVELAPLPQGNR